MRLAPRIANWLERHWVTPAYSGWLILSLTLFFFLAATNTLAGWLYVLSGIGIALLIVAAVLPERMLRQLQVQRQPIIPVSVGDHLTVELQIANRSRQPKALLEVHDQLPHVLGEPQVHSVEVIAPQDHHTWIYYYPTQQRGIYRWHTVDLRTGAPLGLFWCRRSYRAKAMAVVYPTVLALAQCPLVDEMGRDASLLFRSDRRTQSATEGLTRSLRPYRWGDPTRLVHWRTSARYGELRVRELEVLSGGQELIICLDSAAAWQQSAPVQPTDDFEQAVIAAASLYFYACSHQQNVKLWTAGTGLIQGNQVVLEALAATQVGETVRAESLPSVPLIWITPNPVSLSTLPSGSRWLLWPPALTSDEWRAEAKSTLVGHRSAGLVMNREKPLAGQLQSRLSSV